MTTDEAKVEVDRCWYAAWLLRRMPLDSWRDTFITLGLDTTEIDIQLTAFDKEYTDRYGDRGPEPLPPPTFAAK